MNDENSVNLDIKDKRSNLVLILVIIATFLVISGITFGFFVKGVMNNGTIFSNISLSASDSYSFYTSGGNDISINIANINVPSGSAGSFNTSVNVTLASEADHSYECVYDMFLVWNGDPFYNDDGVNETYPYELSSVVRLNNNDISGEVDLGTPLYNSNNEEYRVPLVRSLQIKADGHSIASNNYNVEIKVYDLPIPQVNLVNHTYNGKIRIENVYCGEQLLQNKLLLSEDSSTDINVVKQNINSKAISNTIGMYATQDEYGTSYFYRGNVTNNNIQFGRDVSGKKLYWKIIRINGDGSIRLLYNGKNSVGYSPSIASKAFSSSINNIKYAGFTYPSNNGVSTLENFRPTIDDNTSSTIKTELDNWYNASGSYGTTGFDKINYGSYLADSGFCNDRSPRSTNPSFVAGTEFSFASRDRSNTMDSTHTYICPNQDDLYTTGESGMGNGLLTNPVGLITEDEASLAGASVADYIASYVFSGTAYYTFSPNRYTADNKMRHYIVDASNNTGSALSNTTEAIRPVINLKGGVIYESGDGTSGSPYTISYTHGDNPSDITTYDYIGDTQIFTAEHDGYYQIDAYGASGGYGKNTVYSGGRGGLSEGTIYLEEQEILYIYVGGAGGSYTFKNGTNSLFDGGYNGGGRLHGYPTSGTAVYFGAGGGATDIRFGGNSLNDRIMVAGGGGGGAFSSGTKYNGTGGDGGGLNGNRGTCGAGAYYGTGATQFAGGHFSTKDSYNVGSFGNGGNMQQCGETSTSCAGAGGSGGGGYWGGGGGRRDSGGGGGGSGFISGHLGCVAILSSSSTTPRKDSSSVSCTSTSAESDITCSYHYSGKKFINTTIIVGANEPNANGKVIIKYLGMDVS